MGSPLTTSMLVIVTGDLGVPVAVNIEVLRFTKVFVEMMLVEFTNGPDVEVKFPESPVPVAEMFMDILPVMAWVGSGIVGDDAVNIRKSVMALVGAVAVKSAIMIEGLEEDCA